MFLDENLDSSNFVDAGKSESLVIDATNKNISFLAINRVKSKEMFMDENKLIAKNESANELDNLLDEMLEGFETKKSNKSIEELNESSFFFSENEDILNEGIVASALKFLMKPFHISNDRVENQRQFQKLYSQIAATKNLDDEVFSKNCSRILKYILDIIAKACISYCALFITSFIPLIGQVAYIWVITKLTEDSALRELKENKKVLENAKESFEEKVKNETNADSKKALTSTLNEINKSLNKIDSKITLYEKAKNEDTEFFDITNVIVEDNDDSEERTLFEEIDDLFDSLL